MLVRYRDVVDLGGWDAFKASKRQRGTASIAWCMSDRAYRWYIHQTWIIS
jgi:hypothetical protein